MPITTSSGNYARVSLLDPTGFSPSLLPFTLSVYGKPTVTNTRQTIFNIFPSGIGAPLDANECFLEFNGVSFGNSPCNYSGSTINQGAGSTSKSWINTANHYTTAWNSASVGFPANGTSFGRGQTNGTLVSGTSSQCVGPGLGITKFAVGCSIPADNSGLDVPQQPFTGDIAAITFWIAQLGDREQTALSVGASPRLIRRQSLYSYLPLIKTAFNACYRSTIQTTGSPTFANRPPRQYGW